MDSQGQRDSSLWSVRSSMLSAIQIKAAINHDSHDPWGPTNNTRTQQHGRDPSQTMAVVVVVARVLCDCWVIDFNTGTHSTQQGCAYGTTTARATTPHTSVCVCVCVSWQHKCGPVCKPQSTVVVTEEKDHQDTQHGVVGCLGGRCATNTDQESQMMMAQVAARAL